MFFSTKQGLQLLKDFLQVPMGVYTVNSNFNSCPERLREGIGPILRKDDSCDST